MTRMKPTVLLIGTLDTKGEEIGFLRGKIADCGCDCIIMDVGVLGKPALDARVPRETVIERGGRSVAELTDGSCDRGAAIDTVIRGGTEIALEMLERHEYDGVISLGGGTGTTIGTTIMQGLPFGVPKVQVSTAPGNMKDTRRFFGRKDIMMLNSMVDLVGLNSITRTLLEQAAGAVCGMVTHKPSMEMAKRSVVITCLGVTTPAVMNVRKLLMERGKEVIALHRRTDAVEELMSADLVEAIIDLTPNELIDGVVYPGGAPDAARLRSARTAGIPLIIAPGALDVILLFMPPSDIPEGLKGRPFGIHTGAVTLVSTNEEELRRMGRFYGETLRDATGRVGLVVPLGGFSTRDYEGSSFHNPKGIAGFVEEFRRAAPEGVDINEIDAHINDAAFAEAVIAVFDRLVGKECR